MQAYRGMDIGTAKPEPALRAQLLHHLIDILDPSDQYTAGDFVRLADEACAAITRSGGLPVVSGGTGFYIRNFVYGLPTAPAAEPSLRAAIARELAERGAAALRDELAAADPAAAARIHPNDLYRLTRALEVLRASGRPLSAFAPSHKPRARWRFLLAYLERPREELYARIDARVASMFARGLYEEFERLRRAGYGPDAPGMKAIGYAEFFAAEGAGYNLASAQGLATVAELIKRNTRRYAKRQETFFRALPGLVRIDARDGAATLSRVLRDFLAADQ